MTTYEHEFKYHHVRLYKLYSACHIFFHIILKTNIGRPGTTLSMFRKKEEIVIKMSYLWGGGGSVSLDCQDYFTFYFTNTPF